MLSSKCFIPVATQLAELIATVVWKQNKKNNNIKQDTIIHQVKVKLIKKNKTDNNKEPSAFFLEVLVQFFFLFVFMKAPPPLFMRACEENRDIARTARGVGAASAHAWTSRRDSPLTHRRAPEAPLTNLLTRHSLQTWRSSTIWNVAVYIRMGLFSFPLSWVPSAKNPPPSLPPLTSCLNKQHVRPRLLA